MNKKILIVIILGIFLISLVASAPTPFLTTQSPQGLDVVYRPIDVLSVNQPYRVHVHVFNKTDSTNMTNATVNCFYHLYNISGFDIDAQQMEWESYNDVDWAKTINGGNFSQAGFYTIIIQCYHKTSHISGYADGSFYVTPNGEEATTGKAIFYIGLLFVLLFFLGISIYFFTDTDNLLGKVGSLGMGYLLLIAVTFISWNMAKDFFTSATFIIAMMRIFFYVLLIGLFPLIIGLFIWYFLMLFKIKEIQRLMDRGIGYDEAKKRSGEGGKYK